MFTQNSRYKHAEIIDTTTSDGRKVQAVAPRVLPATKGSPATVKSIDRLDLMAHTNYTDATRFWHIADANTELDASRLVDEPGREINVPEK